MKFEDLPEDIRRTIEYIDIKGHMEALPATDTPMEKYDPVLQKLFPGRIVHNGTAFGGYERSYEYTVFNSGNEILNRASQKNVETAIRLEGDLESMLVLISAVSQYLYFQFFIRKPNWRDDCYFSPETPWHKSAEALILEEFGKLGFKKILPEWAHLRLPDIETDLCDKGEATVMACLF